MIFDLGVDLIDDDADGVYDDGTLSAVSTADANDGYAATGNITTALELTLFE